ncbi:MAG: methyltransferase domain-containing protein [Clostridia bacterium]|nr:methyltransferase domain-containing protein [Clostridia bacterium]
MNFLEKYYNKFNEDKRLLSRHGQVEYTITCKYIDELINNRQNLEIIDIGAGTGRYSIPLAENGHNVTAIELVNKNLSTIKLKSDKVVAKQGNALNLRKIESEKYDITLLFGPLYHLFSQEDKLKAINEAKRVTKKGGYILIMYLMNEYAIITYAFKEGNLQKCLKEGKLDSNFKCQTTEEDLYSYLRLEDINELYQKSGLERVKIIGVDGATDYIRPTLNKLSQEDFEIFIKYQLSICERPELLGASSHILDILKK